jgi:hypothetical protein
MSKTAAKIGVGADLFDTAGRPMFGSAPLSLFSDAGLAWSVVPVKGGRLLSMAPRFSSKVTLENSPVWRARRSAEVVISASVVWRPSTTFQGGRNGIGGGVRLEANVLGQEIGVLAQAIA